MTSSSKPETDVTINHDKCKYLIVGPKKFRENTLKEVESNPLNMGGVIIDHAGNDKYLGDWVNELGRKQIIEDNIKDRMRKLTSKANEIILLADAPMMGADYSKNKFYLHYYSTARAGSE